MFGFIGVAPQEKIVGNYYEVDAELRFDCSKAMESDNVADTLNYAIAVAIIRRELEKPANLLEFAAGRIHKALMHEFPYIESGSLSLYKCQPPISTEVRRVGFRFDW